nr:hypothetical protein [Tanacetum cinerariifolium]
PVIDNVPVATETDKETELNKLTGKGKKPVVGKDKDKPKNIASDVVNEKFKPNLKQKRKKLKIKAGLKRKRSGLDSSDSSEIDTKSIKLLISKLEKKVKKAKSDEESVPKKFKKKLSKKVEKEVSDEESFPKKGNKNLKKKVKKEESDEDSIPKKGVPFGGYSLFDLDERETNHEFLRK